jgi:hypothetical protein
MITIIESRDGWHRAELIITDDGIQVTIERKLARGDSPWKQLHRETVDAPLHLVRDLVTERVRSLKPDHVGANLKK